MAGAEIYANDSPPLRVFIFDNPRCRSHLWFPLLSQHPRFEKVYHPYLLTVGMGPYRVHEFMRHSEERHHEITVTTAPLYITDTREHESVKLMERLDEIEKKGKTFLSSEHLQCSLRADIILGHLHTGRFPAIAPALNPTYLPDALFSTITPILIRHPALQIPSFYKEMRATTLSQPSDEDFTFMTELSYTRYLFDVYRARGTKCVVVDGEDVIWRTLEISNAVCNALGIEQDCISDQWGPFPPEELPTNPLIAHFTKPFYESSGIVRPAEKPSGPVDTEKQLRKVEEQWGKEVAESLRPHIVRILPDYEYLKQFAV